MKPLTILIAGPYRSGTGGDARLLERNLHVLEQAALAVYRLGHLPMIGEWLALPLARAAGSTALGDAVSEEFLYPVAARLLQRCDAVYRIEGASKGADQDVRIAQELELPVYVGLEQIPAAV